MPPRFEPPDEDEILQLAKRLQSGGVVSQRTVFVTTIASAASGLLAVIYGTWFFTDRLKDFTHQVALIGADVASLRAEIRNGADRWKLKHEVEIWADFERRNRMLKLDMPDPYAVKLKLGE